MIFILITLLFRVKLGVNDTFTMKDKQKKISVETAWRDYQKMLFSFIRAKVETEEDAEELLSDVFEKLTITVAKNTVPTNLSAWLYRVAKNRIVDYYRAKKSLQPLPDDISVLDDDTNTIKELSNCMLPMIQALPDRYQQPLILSEIEGKKYKDVASELNLTVSAVKSRILRGREKLHNSIASCCIIYRNEAGESIDYEQKSANSCGDCKK